MVWRRQSNYNHDLKSTATWNKITMPSVYFNSSKSITAWKTSRGNRKLAQVFNFWRVILQNITFVSTEKSLKLNWTKNYPKASNWERRNAFDYFFLYLAYLDRSFLKTIVLIGSSKYYFKLCQWELDCLNPLL